ncbi:MAG: T4 family baseplate hub assembly chaperone [Planctomycetota bacterium]|jgi:hypothetical protein
MDKLSFRLPGGYVDQEGTVHQEGEIAPLSGREEELLAGNHRQESATLVTAVLRCCIRRLGEISSISEDVVRSLLVEDRQYLLLKLREATFGDQIQATISCPWPDCRKRVDIDFLTEDVPIKESEEKGPTYEMELSPEAAFVDDDDKKYRKIIFRLPNGADQEAVSPLLSDNEARALTMLLARCVQSIGPLKNPGNISIGGLSPLARKEIESRMAKVAPRVELNLKADCPECERPFGMPFDLHRYFFGEIRTGLDLLYREVHYLAYHYHWSEQEIMEMPREKRRKYIEVLADETERLNNAIR